MRKRWMMVVVLLFLIPSLLANLYLLMHGFQPFVRIDRPRVAIGLGDQRRDAFCGTGVEFSGTQLRNYDDCFSNRPHTTQRLVGWKMSIRTGWRTDLVVPVE